MRRLATALALLALTSAAFAADIEGFAPETGRSLALGGPHAALADDFSALFSNPASLASVPRQLYVSRLAVKASGPVFDIANALMSADMKTSLTDLLAASGYQLYAGADIQGPFSFGYAGGGLGFGFFNGTHASLDAASASSITVNVSEDLLLIGGYAFRIDLGGGHDLDLGVSAKGFARGAVSESLGAVEFFDLLSDFSALFGLPFTLTMGVGVDAGIRWNWDEVISAGLVCRDAYSPAIVTTYDDVMAFASDPAAAHPSSSSGTLKRDLSVGATWKPRLGKFERYVDALAISLDYRDILDLFSMVPRNAILNVSAGVEARVLDILSLRVGVHEALLAAGVGLDLSVMKVEMATYGTELGLDPGDRPTYNMLLSFDFAY